jgi:hypothetical protein
MARRLQLAEKICVCVLRWIVRAAMQQQDGKRIRKNEIYGDAHSHFRRPFQLIALTAGWPLRVHDFQLLFMQIVVERFENSSSWNTIVSAYLGVLPATPISLTDDELSKIVIALPRVA